VLLLAAVASLSGTAAAASPEATVLRVAWVPVAVGPVDGDPRLTAVETPIDLQLLGAAAARAGIGITVVPLGRAAAEAALAAGAADLLLPSADATPPASQAYRTERDVLLCARALPDLRGQGRAALQEAYGRGWRIATVRDAPYRPDIRALVDESPVGRTLGFSHVGPALAALAGGTADCLVAPRLAILGALAADPALESAVAYRATDLGGTDLRLRYGAGVAPATVAALDAAFAGLRADGTAARLETRAARPVLLRFAVAPAWIGWLGVIGTVAFALSGVLIARAEGFSLLGAFVLADPLPLLLVVGTVLAAYAAVRLGRWIVPRAAGLRRLPAALSPAAAMEVTDAMGLAAFTVLGVSAAASAGAEPLWLWGPLAAGLSGAGGGILRDLLRSGYENPALRTSFYAEVCVLWGGALTAAILLLLRAEQPVLIRLTVGIAVLDVFFTRLAVVALGIRSPRF